MHSLWGLVWGPGLCRLQTLHDAHVLSQASSFLNTPDHLFLLPFLKTHFKI